MNCHQPNNLIETIPPSQHVRERLGAALREAKLLRQLLKLAERAEHDRQQRKPQFHDDSNSKITATQEATCGAA